MSELPPFTAFVDPLLRELATKPEGLSTHEAYETVAERMKLSEAQKAQRLPSGQQATYKNRIGWANDALKRAGFSHSPRHAIWCLTESAHALLAQHPLLLPEHTIDHITTVGRRQKITNLQGRSDNIETPPDQSIRQGLSDTEPPAQSPEERFEVALDEIDARVARELLERIATEPPEFFERMVLRLLEKLGYGNTGSIEHTGGSGDGGIDGIISIDRLGLEKVYMQAKRYEPSRTIHSKDLRDFLGALSSNRATKGIFVTTASYDHKAQDSAKHAAAQVVLIDGAQLARLMIETGLGVSRRVVHVPTFDTDFFDET